MKEGKMNGATNGIAEGSEDGEVNNWKKLRASRLMKDRAKSQVPIKIEDDSDEELEAKTKSKNVEYVDKGVQTDNVALMETLRKLVQERMRQYQVAASNDKCILDKALSPKLEKLERENEELRKYAFALKCQLDLREKEKEKQSLKRPHGDIETPLPAKSSSAPVTLPPPYTVAMAANVNVSVDNSNTVAATRTMAPRQVRPAPPPLLPVNSSLSQPRPVSNFLNQPRVPLQVANNLRQISPSQPIMRHPFVQNERFMLANNNNIPMSGINTHVVSSNPGLRMTSMPPDVNGIIRPPMDTRAHLFNGPPNMGANGQLYNQFLQRMPGNVMNPQLRPVQNAVRPFSQPPQPPNMPNVNIPFSPLPKLTANISTSNNAIVLTWDYETSENKEIYKVECYQLFAHQAKDARVAPPQDTKQWKKIGVVNALPLPMACTLTQFASGSVYFFAVVAVDVNGREGEMSNPCVIRLDVNR